MRSIFLCADGLDPKIQEFRERNDPLGMLIEPHITLVFPFESDLSDEALIEHVEAQLVTTNSFHASLCPLPTVDSAYVYFSILHGKNQILALHEHLYSGALAQHLQPRPYVPHITVGQGNAEQVKPMVDEATALGISDTFSVRKLKIERIGDCGASNLLKTFYLD